MRNYGENTKDKYLGLKRLLALLASVGLWAVSIYFSYSGFKFDSTEILWFGIVLALVVTVVELVFNTKIDKLNPTLLVSGIICYAYGIYTNITGFYVLQHTELIDFWKGSNWIIPIFAGLVCEVLPEALFAWSLGAHDDGDLIGNVSDMFNQEKIRESNVRSNYSIPRVGNNGVRDFLNKQSETRGYNFKDSG